MAASAIQETIQNRLKGSLSKKIQVLRKSGRPREGSSENLFSSTNVWEKFPDGGKKFFHNSQSLSGNLKHEHSDSNSIAGKGGLVCEKKTLNT